ncbi:MAG TPA: NAD(P)/FAD-dependent oxidoreductase [Chloroflexota bacterium]|nr:NAD(P)/FAD-dependent oxidoreductase [Chloroflexota bacterium]
MNVRREALEESYDVIVVGSGLGGISAAALLAKAGKKVLVVERHDRPGGYAHSFQRGKYKFDSAVHVTTGAEETGFGDLPMIHYLLKLLGVRDRVNFLPVDPFYTTIFPDLRFDAPPGTQEFLDAHVQLFPHEERGLRQLMRLHTRVSREMKKLPSDISPYETLRNPEDFPLHTQYGNATLAQVMDELLTEPRLKALFGSLWGYQGLPPSKLSFLKWVPMIVGFSYMGVYYCEGTFQNMVNAIVWAFERDGGEMLLRSHVRRILVRDGKVAGVMLENGQRIHAPVVISNADATETFDELVGGEYLPSDFLPNLRQLKPALSAVLLYMATDLDLEALGATHEMFLYRTWDHDETYQHLLDGKPSGVTLTIPTLLDSSLAPPGEHLISVTSLISYDSVSSWRQEKERYGELLLDEIEWVFPEIRKHVKFMEGGTPRTLERYTLNLSGAIYGWEQSPEQSGINRLGRRTPIEGLFLSGHWTQPGGGVITVVVSGVQTAQVVLGYPDVMDFFKAMEALNVTV